MTAYRTIDSAAERLFNGELMKAQDKFIIKKKETSTGLKLAGQFEELKSYKSVYVHNVTELKGATSSCIILLIEKHLTIVEYRKHGTIEREIEEIEPMLLFTIPQDIGKAYIREETFADKFVDLFNKVDIDFPEYPKFSRSYYLAAEKPALVRANLPQRLLQSLDEIQGLTIEIQGNWVLLRTGKNLDASVLQTLLNAAVFLTR